MFPCPIDTISWVEVILDTDHAQKNLAQYEEDYERLVRMRLENDLSTLKQEVRSPDDLDKTYGSRWLQAARIKPYSPEMARRATVYCNVRAVIGGTCAASQVDCALVGLGVYGLSEESANSSDDEVRSNGSIGVCDKSNLDGHIRDLLRDQVADLAQKYFELRRTWVQVGTAQPQTAPAPAVSQDAKE